MTKLLPAIALTLVAALFAGACTNNPARRIDPSGTETITTTDKLDIQDATDAAGAMSESLLASGVLGRDGEPSIIAIDRYVNNTTQQIDRDEVVKKIRVTLNKAGVAQTLTTIDSRGETGGESNIASKFARENVDAAPGSEGNAITPDPLVPDYALTYKILENRAKAGKIRQTTFTFQMSLVDVRNGLAVWEDEQQVTKQGDKAAVGW
ncbi:MAG: hypothetical protein AAF911_05750 [Planctomycetota bacterium]